MLQLAVQLLESARQDKKTSVPVIFNLSSWAVERKPLDKWIIDELKHNYGANEKLSKEWINGDSLIYLLDGLDEVAEIYRDDCLTAINQFISTTRQLVICSRIDEYSELSNRLNTSNAIELQPLTRKQAENLLQKHILSAKTVSKIINLLQSDTEMWEEVNKPLFINILIATYGEGKSFDVYQIDGDSLLKIQQLVIKPYLNRQLRNKPLASITNEQILRYLAWISANLRQHKQSLFFIEMIQTDWLPIKTDIERLFLVFRLLNVLIGVLIFGMIVSINLPFLGLLSQKMTPTHAVIFGLTISINVLMWIMIGAMGRKRIDIEQRVIVDWRNIKIRWLVLGLSLGLLFGGFNFGSRLGLIVGLIFGPLLGLVVAVRGSSQISQRNKFNQGLKDTFNVGLIVGLIGGLIFGLIGGLLFGLIGGLLFGLIGGLLFGLIGGLNHVLRHLILRSIIYKQTLAPKRYDSFLQHVVRCRIMRRVGGGVIFIHRYILEYFAEEWKQNYSKEFEI